MERFLRVKVMSELPSLLQCLAIFTWRGQGTPGVSRSRITRHGYSNIQNLVWPSLLPLGPPPWSIMPCMLLQLTGCSSPGQVIQSIADSGKMEIYCPLWQPSAEAGVWDIVMIIDHVAANFYGHADQGTDYTLYHSVMKKKMLCLVGENKAKSALSYTF
ncbi:hypothetical protein F5X96DRAFT_53874 [Biscogniauxia mediterranea]|nr:hypothetical protein F5X96DRAFT_53874 [Biscogniauxia mediterranea]